MLLNEKRKKGTEREREGKREHKVLEPGIVVDALPHEGPIGCARAIIAPFITQQIKG